MTSTGPKYNTSATNLYNQDRYVSGSGNYSSSRRPIRNNRSRFAGGGEDDTDGEDKRLLSLSERIKKLSSSKVLKDNSFLTHNNNEPFTYLRPNSKPSPPKTYQNQNHVRATNKPLSREVIYAQVVVDPEDRKRNPAEHKSKRTVHRSYNNKNYDSSAPHRQPYSGSGINRPPAGIDSGLLTGNKMRGRNVTTVLLNSSSDDIPSSLNIDDKFATDTRFRSSSSPLLASNDDFYPKSPGIVKHLQNGYQNNSTSRTRFETNNYQRNSTDYFNLNRGESDEDDYFHRRKIDSRERSPFGKDDSDQDFYNNYQPVNYSYGQKSASTNFMDSYGYHGGTTASKFRSGGALNYRIDEEDEYDVTRNTKFEDRRSKTLDRDGSFTFNKKGLPSSADFIQRSKTLDNRLSTLREKSQRLNASKRTDLNDEFDFKVTSKTKQESSTSKKGTTGTNIFSTLLRKKVPKEPNNNGVKMEKVDKKPKAAGSNGNFFTSFLEKKRKKQQINAEKKTKGQTSTIGIKNQSGTYQSYSDWPPPAPPTLNVTDYSEPPTPISKTFYGESNIDTEDSNAHGSDIWKKSYGSDLKLKRRWTMKEPTKPSVIREEEDLSSRTLGRKTSTYIGPSTGNLHSSSIDRRNRTYSTDRDENYDTTRKGRYFDETDSFLKVPGSTGPKYNTTDRYSSPEKRTFDDYDQSRYNTLNRRGKLKASSDKLNKGYNYGGGGIGTPNSSGSESNKPRVNGSLRSVFLHEPAVIPEMPRTATTTGGGGSVGGGASISGLSGRRTLSKDEISNYSGPRKETKQLSRSMSFAHPFAPNKHYKEKYRELDYSQSNNLHLPPRPPSRSPSGSVGLSRQTVKPGETNIKRSPSKAFAPTKTRTPSTLSSSTKNLRKPMNSSVESLLRQDTPGPPPERKKGSTKLGRSKSISVPQSTAKDSNNKGNLGNRFSTLWFNKRNANK